MNNRNPLKINISKVVHETIDCETILLNLETGNYFSLDNTGEIIWKLVGTGQSINEIIETLKQRFEDKNNEVESSTIQFIRELVREDLVIFQEEGVRVDSEQPEKNSILRVKNVQDCYYSPPVLNKYTDMQDLLQLDPIHDVIEGVGWPAAKINESSNDS
jgi:hypothetical protein